jgi:hypothetical protein
MIRIPLVELKVALSNPSKYAKSFRPGEGGGGPSKYGMLLFAIGEFHKTNDPQKAQEYLDLHITKNFKNVSDLDKYANWLQVYVREFRALGNNFVGVRDNIAMPLPARFSGLTVSGQAARIDLNPAGGYSVWVFVRDEPSWKEDPRMPLLQLAYSQKLGVGLDDVSVGTFDFVAGKHATVRYSRIRVNKTQRALWKLLILIQRKK